MHTDNIMAQIARTERKIAQLERLYCQAERYNGQINWTMMTAEDCAKTASLDENLNLELAGECSRIEWLYERLAANYQYDDPG